jgi:hypothetical protein
MTETSEDMARKDIWLERNAQRVLVLAQHFLGSKNGIIRTGITNAMKEPGCAICNEKDPVALVFHHVVPGQKRFDIQNKSYSLPDFIIEMSKCIVVCANCHAKIHAGHIILKFEPA